jgi:hypothetical protein
MRVRLRPLAASIALAVSVIFRISQLQAAPIRCGFFALLSQTLGLHASRAACTAPLTSASCPGQREHELAGRHPVAPATHPRFNPSSLMNMPPPVPAPSVKSTSGLAIAALICGILSIIGGALFIIPFLLAIIFGHIALAQCNRDPEVGGKGLAIAGLAMGYASILLFGLMAAMAIPAFNKVREASMQKAMANNARMIAGAAQQIMMTNGNQPVSFSIDPTTGKVSGPLAEYVSQITPGTVGVDSTFQNERDGFSLRHPKTYGGAEIRFDIDGRKIDGP